MFETYSIIQGADESILKLNSVLEGYEFVRVSLEELERDFANLFNPVSNFVSEGSIQLEDGQLLSREFYSAITTRNTFIDFSDICERYQIMLRSRSNISRGDVQEQNSYLNEVFALMGRHQRGLDPILEALRLTASGYIGTSVTFQIEKPSHKVYQRLIPIRKNQIRGLKFSIQDEQQIQDFKIILQKLPLRGNNFELAFNTFKASYEMSDSASDFIMCITALESIFNQTKEQISHTISRHLSVIISSNIKEFKENYRKIKKIYNKRSKLVHGGSNEVNDEDLIMANELIRRALRFCLDKKFTREELFEYCNSRGFSEMEFRPIKTEADYQKALAEIKALFDAAPNTAEFDRLDILSTLVEAYEKKHYPIGLPETIVPIE
jgi:Apea-like HEPN